MNLPVNSRQWWEEYFEKHWDANMGSEQTRYFMESLLSNLPIAELTYLHSKRLDFLDWGSAFGEGVKLIAQTLPKSHVAGLDFALNAIKEARKRYPELEFILAEDGKIPRRFDVIITSNCLEHFENPLEVMKMHMDSCKNLYIAMVPYNEYPLSEYHRSQFREESFPDRLGNFARLYVKKIEMDPAYYNGRQLLVLYGSESYLRERPSTDDQGTEREKWDKYYSSLPLGEEDNLMRAFNEEFVATISELLPEGGEILETGCGGGWQSLALARAGFRVSLLDFSPEALKYAKRLFERENLRAEFLFEDAFIPGKGDFDLVFNAGVLEHYTLEEQVAFLRGMASRSLKYVLALVPNRLCYWYWIWRIHKSAKGEWPFGKEVPLSDLSHAFKQAGLHFKGYTFIGENWTGSFLSGLSGIDEGLRNEILKIHHSPIIPKAQKCYLLAALGGVQEELKVPSTWNSHPLSEDMKISELNAALADALALRVSAENKLNQLQTQLNQMIAEKDNLWSQLNRIAAERDTIQAIQAQLNQTIVEKDALSSQLNQAVAEKDNLWNQLNNIYSSDFWKVASWYYRVRERSSMLKGLYFSLKWLKRMVKSTPYPDYISKFKSYAKRYGIRKAVKKSLLKIIGRDTKIVSTASGESADILSSENILAYEIYAGGIKDRVSIVLPVYNQANYLKEAIEGVLNQTYEDIELIVINDGSTDGVEEVLDMYVSHPKVKIFTQENQKLPRALNNGFQHATGEFFTWTSADNIMLPNQIEELVKFLKENPDADMVFSDYQAIDDRGLPLNDLTFRPHNQDRDDPSIMRLPNVVTFENLHDSGDNFIGASFIYGRHVAKIVGNYTHDTFGGEDYDYWLRLNSLFRIKHLNRILYKYRVHENTLNAKAKELNLFENIQRLLERDRLRRDFYKKGFNIIWVGLEQQNHLLDVDDKILLIFRYSLKNSSEVIKNLGSSSAVSICVIDAKMDECSIDDEILNVSDYIITTDIDNFDVLYTTYENKLFNIRNIEGNLELFIKMANSTLFNRIMKLSYEKKPASIYLENRRLNIAFQVENFDRGGLEQVVYDLATHIDKERFNLCGVIVVDRDGLMGAKLKSKGIDILKVSSSLDAYKSVLKNKKIDILNSHYTYFGIDKAAELGTGVIETIHNSYTWLDSEKIKEINQISRFIDKYVAVSRQVKNYHRRKFKISSKDVEIIPNGLNLEGFNETGWNKFTRNSFGFSEKDLIFLNVASFNGVKCHHLMLSTVKDLIGNFPNIKLIFIGDVLDRGLYNDIRNRIKMEGLEGNIKVMDFLDRTYLKDIYQVADCFILPSIQEGWSIAAMEAMYFKLPMIISDIGSARDIIKDNDIGIIIKNPYEDLLSLSTNDIAELSKFPKNLLELKAAMLNIYNNRDAWKEKAKKGRDKVLNEFSIERMARTYEDIFIQTYHIDRKNIKS